jgi:hypothetical protein
MGLKHQLVKLLINVKIYPIKCFYLIDALRNFAYFTIVKHVPDGSKNEIRNCKKICTRVSKNIQDVPPIQLSSGF